VADQRKTPIAVPAAIAGTKQALLQMRLAELNSCTLELQTAVGRLGQLSREEARGLSREIRQATALARGAEDWIITELAFAADPPGPGYGSESTPGRSARILVRG